MYRARRRHPKWPDLVCPAWLFAQDTRRLLPLKPCVASEVRSCCACTAFVCEFPRSSHTGCALASARRSSVSLQIPVSLCMNERDEMERVPRQRPLHSRHELAQRLQVRNAGLFARFSKLGSRSWQGTFVCIFRRKKAVETRNARYEQGGLLVRPEPASCSKKIPKKWPCN